MASSPHTTYDRTADTLYVTFKRAGHPAVGREEGEPGVYWRYDLKSGKLIGVTILDFEEFWRPQLDQLIDALATKFSISRDEASNVLKTVH